MKKYEVIPLYLSGKGKRVFNDGDIVTESDFAPDSIPRLLAGGYVKEISEPAQQAVLFPVEEPAGEQITEPATEPASEPAVKPAPAAKPASKKSTQKKK
jgi:hypothetical protein